MQTFIFEISKNFPSNIKKDIDSLISTLPYSPIWQTLDWQLMLQETGYADKSFFVGIYEKKRLLSYALLEKRSIGLGQYGLFAIGGPVFEDEALLDSLSEALRTLGKKEKVVFVQCEPLNECTLSGFTIGQYKNFIEKHTALINLRQSEEEILARMKQKGRYNIRVAEKSWVTVESVSFSEENLNIFYSLLSETTERDAFSVNSRKYFEVFLRYLEKWNLGGLAFARRDALTPNPCPRAPSLTPSFTLSPKGERGEVIAAGIFVFFGNTAFYYYGASSSDNTKRKYMASYLLQWEMIRDAKRRGCEIFDFLGIAGPNESDSHLAGVTDFKLKLTDEVREWPTSQILVMRMGWWWVLRVIRRLRQK